VVVMVREEEKERDLQPAREGGEEGGKAAGGR